MQEMVRAPDTRTGDPTVFNAYIGLRIESPAWGSLHCTLTFIENATSLDRIAAWRDYVAALGDALPLALQLGAGLQLGENKDVPARRVHFADAALEKRLAALYRVHTRRENNPFPDWLPHVSIATADKQAALAALGDVLVVTTLYMAPARSGADYTATDLATLSMRERLARKSD